MATALQATPVPETVRAWLRPEDGGSELRVDGKDEAIHVRQLLVRHGWHCTFPVPTWQRSRYAVHVTRPAEVSHAELERAVAGLDGVELQRDRS